MFQRFLVSGLSCLALFSLSRLAWDSLEGPARPAFLATLYGGIFSRLDVVDVEKPVNIPGEREWTPTEWRASRETGICWAYGCHMATVLGLIGLTNLWLLRNGRNRPIEGGGCDLFSCGMCDCGTKQDARPPVEKKTDLPFNGGPDDGSATTVIKVPQRAPDADPYPRYWRSAAGARFYRVAHEGAPVQLQMSGGNWCGSGSYCQERDLVAQENKEPGLHASLTRVPAPPAAVQPTTELEKFDSKVYPPKPQESHCYADTYPRQYYLINSLTLRQKNCQLGFVVLKPGGKAYGGWWYQALPGMRGGVTEQELLSACEAGERAWRTVRNGEIEPIHPSVCEREFPA